MTVVQHKVGRGAKQPRHGDAVLVETMVAAFDTTDHMVLIGADSVRIGRDGTVSMTLTPSALLNPVTPYKLTEPDGTVWLFNVPSSGPAWVEDNLVTAPAVPTGVVVGTTSAQLTAAIAAQATTDASTFVPLATAAGAPSYAPAGLRNRFDATRSTYNLKASNTKKARAKLQQAGTSRYKIALAGHSEMAGYGASIGTTDPAVQMRKMFAARNVPIGGTGFVMANYWSAGTTIDKDSRWVHDAAATATATAPFIAYAASGKHSIFTTDVAGSVVDILTYGNTAAFTQSINGAGAAAITPAGGTAPQVISITAAIAAGQTVDLATTSASGVYIAGVNVRGTTGVEITNAGAESSLASGWNNGAAFGLRNTLVNGVQPDVVCLQLGANEALNGISADTFQTNMATLITNLQGAGIEVYLEYGLGPSTVLQATWDAFGAAHYALAETFDVPLLDLNVLYGPWATANSLGLIFDTIHPNAAGYGIAAQARAAMLGVGPAVNPVTPAAIGALANTKAAVVATGLAAGDIGAAPIPTGTPDGTKFYRDDNTWAVPPGGGGSSIAHFSTQPLLSKLTLNYEDANILVIGDSTGDAPTAAATTTYEWVYLLAQNLASRFPAYTVKYWAWNDTTHVYDLIATIQTGTGGNVVGTATPGTAHVLNVWNMSILGTDTNYVRAPYFETMVTPTLADLVMFSQGHNDQRADTQDFLGGYVAMCESVTATLSKTSAICIAQNPNLTSTELGKQAEHATAIEQYCAVRGFGFINIYQTFLDAAGGAVAWLQTDNKHPTNNTSTNTYGNNGSVLWANEVIRHFAYSTASTTGIRATGMSSLLTVGEQLLVNGKLVQASSTVVPTSWTNNNCTFSQDTTNFESENGYSVVLTPTTGAAAYISQNLTAAALKRVLGRTICLAVRHWIPAGATSGIGRLDIVWAGGANPGSILSRGTVNGQGAFKWTCLHATIPADATSVSIRIYADTASTGVSGVKLDRATLVRGILPRDVVWNA